MEHLTSRAKISGYNFSLNSTEDVWGLFERRGMILEDTKLAIMEYEIFLGSQKKRRMYVGP